MISNVFNYRRFCQFHLHLFTKVPRIIEKPQKNGYEIIGYARKSPTGEDVACRTRLLKSMVSSLKERSFATKISVSSCIWASSRDLQGNLQVMDDLSVDGNTQDLLAYLKSVRLMFAWLPLTLLVQ
ncbi:hypothetical protein BCV72DRAFT_225928 [Rhizopus microsporus var. microsporus]|uniref:Uncharacterized protein n=2 Tax=Rhizopus microsporus TaxID=58291 RepID=A0A2G4T2L9_RHIZD|nr:uncharacterized protein RHIMIDRAFT_271858 [Rhizopus microsporus ATCC 52813]ORE07831.1 hypothetical protein BCV72DRAFT_225928 [Rhizopus microsporus var. microsporus]PHZ15247.1 hypothetical protein RHIMIDRAFT_271858 [Rhizopus microsporus ATCC 52813]